MTTQAVEQKQNIPSVCSAVWSGVPIFAAMNSNTLPSHDYMNRKNMSPCSQELVITRDASMHTQVSINIARLPALRTNHTAPFIIKYKCTHCYNMM